MKDPETIAKEIIAAYGGKKAFLEKTEAQWLEYNSLWSQSVEIVGRVLRAHLILEHYLTRYIQFINSGLGNIDDARLSFSQKLDLLGSNDKLLEALKPGIRHVNKIRNRFAHDLGGTVTNEDKAVFGSIQIYSALVKAVDRQLGIDSPEEPIEVLEDFSKFVSRHLQQNSTPEGNYWTKVLGNA